MKKYHNYFSLSVVLFILLTSCQPSSALVEESPDERLEQASTESFSLPEATADPGLLPTKTPGDTTSLPTVTADIQTIKYYTYPFTQTAINQFCLKVPGNDFSTPLYFGNRYLVSLNDLTSLNISSVSLADGSLTPLHIPEFPNGYPFGLVNFDYPWYTYSMSSTPTGSGDWHIHAVNLETGENAIIASFEEYGSHLLHTNLSLDNGTVFLVSSTFADGYDILSSRLFSIDLETKEVKLLIDSEDKKTFLSIIAASNGYIVIENDPPENETDRYLSLYNIEENEFVDLPQDFPASMPDMEYPYIVWKNDLRFANPSSLTIYNIETGETIKRDIVGRDSYDPSISDGYIVTQASTGKDYSRNSVMLYSLEKGDTYAVQVLLDVNNLLITGAYIDDGYLIWSFSDITTFDNKTGYLCRMPLDEVLSNSEEGIDDSLD